MADAVLKLEGARELVEKLRELGADIEDLSGQIAERVGRQIKQRLTREPPPNREPMTFVSAKQRAWFFWALEEGVIEVPYRRSVSPTSQNLSQSWTVRRRGSGAEVGTKVTYARYVQSEEDQAPRHAAWPTDASAIEDTLKADDVDKIADRILSKALRRL
jgi:hypothetical protein